MEFFLFQIDILIRLFYLLQNLSFKYDCLPMVISMGLACFYVFKDKNTSDSIDYILRFLTLFALFCFYQSAVTLVLGLLTIKILMNEKPFSLILKDVAFKTFNILLTFLVYKIYVVKILITKDFAQSAKIISLNSYVIIHLMLNIKKNIFFFLVALFY